MALDALGHLLEELSPLVKTELKINQQSSCMFKFEDVYVQIEIEKQGNELLLVSQLGVIPTGRYREVLFQEALKQNGICNPSSGIFAYSKQTEALIIFQKFPLKEISGDKLYAFLPSFCSQAKLWTEAISRGETPRLESASSKGGPGGLFGFTR